MKKFRLAILGLLVLMLCGCTGYKEIDRGYLVTAIGYKTKNDITTIYIEALSSSDVSEEKNKRIVLTGIGNSDLQAYENLKNTLVKPLYFEQVGTIIVESKTNFNNDFLKNIGNINLGVYIVKTNDVTSLFENDTPNGVLGYDVIALIKTHEKEGGKVINNQLYQMQNISFNMPVVNFKNGNLILE